MNNQTNSPSKSAPLYTTILIASLSYLIYQVYLANGLASAAVSFFTVFVALGLSIKIAKTEAKTEILEAENEIFKAFLNDVNDFLIQQDLRSVSYEEQRANEIAEGFLKEIEKAIKSELS